MGDYRVEVAGLRVVRSGCQVIGLVFSVFCLRRSVGGLVVRISVASCAKDKKESKRMKSWLEQLSGYAPLFWHAETPRLLGELHPKP